MDQLKNLSNQVRSKIRKSEQRINLIFEKEMTLTMCVDPKAHQFALNIAKHSIIR
jgi:hypothetical protein